jgi:peptide/nickel transport system ATP-binding protein
VDLPILVYCIVLEVRAGYRNNVFKAWGFSLFIVIPPPRGDRAIIHENREVAPSCTDLDKKEAALQSRRMLSDVKIPNPEEVAKQYPHQLSGGMRQRVMIAMALACKPDLLIADEPTTALDVTIQAQILKLMNDLQREKGTAILFITHDLGVINQMADDVAVMYSGEVVEMASVETIFTPGQYSHPYTEGLMLSIPRLDTAVQTKLEVIPGVVPHPLDLPTGCFFAPRCKYATDKCRSEHPALEGVAEGHTIRCFYPDKVARNERK